MRILAIGDLHGCLTALRTLADQVVFQPEDTVITLGDYVDRGPDSKGVIDFLIDLRQRCHLIPLGGNHELMMLDARKAAFSISGWLMVGGAETVESYGSSLSDVPEEHWDFIKSSKAFHETEAHFFVHANAHPKRPLEKQNEDDLFWRPFGNPTPHVSGKTMICGHSSQRSGLPKNVGHAICIDTFVYGDGGWLTCLDVDSGKYWQANQQGEHREGDIEEQLENSASAGQ